LCSHDPLETFKGHTHVQCLRFMGYKASHGLLLLAHEVPGELSVMAFVVNAQTSVPVTAAVLFVADMSSRRHLRLNTRCGLRHQYNTTLLLLAVQRRIIYAHWDGFVAAYFLGPANQPISYRIRG